ncbi:hypothetical protein [Sphingomonas sp. 66-10]|uniref:hypothetical protein n=1 Tax=Sphingomonas sp. 66-10 TaxID=1895848 RepID=UPI000AD5C54B|nr:hypothetical protein [Sphingomonas sp. 66-10]
MNSHAEARHFTERTTAEQREIYERAKSPRVRSSKREVRNPLLALAGVAALRSLPIEVRQQLADAARAIQADARDRADKCWRKHKAPMAAYWKAVGVYAGHFARAIKDPNNG